MNRLRQPTQQMKLRLDCPGPVDLDVIDDWLQSALEISIDEDAALIPLKHDTDTHLMAGLAWRVLLLVETLLHAANVPSFEAGQVLAINSNAGGKGTWIATAEIPRIDQIPARIYSVAINEAVKFILWMMANPRTPEQTQVLYERITQSALTPLGRMQISGKSTLHVLRAAHARDIPFSHLGMGIYQLGWGRKARRLERSTTDRDAAVGAKLAQNKVMAAKLLRTSGLPAPRHGVAASVEEATHTARRIGWPVVVKPVDRDRGEGVTVGVRNDEQLRAAFKMAMRLSRNRQVIVEREVSGFCHRLFVIRHHLLFAVRRLPKSIHGDGLHTVAELIRRANEEEGARPPWARTPRFHDDILAQEAMTEAGYTLDSIPAEGTRVPLRKFQSTAWGGIYEDVTESVHPDNLDIALRATKLFNLEVAGIDIISSDIGRPWHENGAIINEVNFAPMLGNHATSRRMLPAYLDQFIDGDGRIPIEVIVGGDAAMALAFEKQKAFADRQVNCFVTSHQVTRSPENNERTYPFESLYRRCQALLTDSQVEAILLVVQSDELLHTGLPVDRIQHISLTDENLLTHGRPDLPLKKNRLDKLLALLNRFTLST